MEDKHSTGCFGYEYNYSNGWILACKRQNVLMRKINMIFYYSFTIVPDRWEGLGLLMYFHELA